MKIDIITIFPEFFNSTLDFSILKKAQENNVVDIQIHNLRDYSENKQKSVDDYQFGGGAGMVMNIQPIYKCIEELKSNNSYDEIIYLTPDGQKLNQSICNNLSLKQNIILLCGHYKGIDHRIREHLITKEISIGDFVLSGGELPAALVCDSIIRLIPGVLGDETSALTDSFQDGLLAPPVFTRPAEWRGLKVPEVLLSGHAKKIEDWRYDQAFQRTKALRPDLLD